MKISIEPTSKIVEMDGVPVRIWEGASDEGMPVVVFIARVSVPDGLPIQAYMEFERALGKARTPSPAVVAIPLRMVL